MVKAKTRVKVNQKLADIKKSQVLTEPKRKPIVGRAAHENYKFIDFETRVEVIYDNFTHNL